MAFEGFLGADELAAAQEALWLHYPQPEEYFADPAAPRLAGRRPVGGHRRRAVAVVESQPTRLPPRPGRPGRAVPRFGRPPALRGGAVGQVRRGRRLRPAPPPRLRQPQPRRAQALQPATQMATWILLSDVGDEDGPTKIVPLSVGRERPVLAGPRESRHHQPPPRGDVRRRRGLDDGSRRDLVRVPHRRPPPWVAHDRRTIEPASRCSPTTTCGHRGGPAGSPGPQRATGPDWFEIVERASPRGAVAVRFPRCPATRTGTSRRWPTRRRATPGPISRPTAEAYDTQRQNG